MNIIDPNVSKNGNTIEITGISVPMPQPVLGSVQIEEHIRLAPDQDIIRMVNPVRDMLQKTSYIIKSGTKIVLIPKDVHFETVYGHIIKFFKNKI